MNAGWFSSLVDLLISRDPQIRSRLIYSWIAIYGYAAGTAVMLTAASMGLTHTLHTWALLAYVWGGVITFYMLVRSGWSIPAWTFPNPCLPWWPPCRPM